MLDKTDPIDVVEVSRGLSWHCHNCFNLIRHQTNLITIWYEGRVTKTHHWKQELEWIEMEVISLMSSHVIMSKEYQ